MTVAAQEAMAANADDWFGCQPRTWCSCPGPTIWLTHLDESDRGAADATLEYGPGARVPSHFAGGRRNAVHHRPHAHPRDARAGDPLQGPRRQVRADRSQLPAPARRPLVWLRRADRHPLQGGPGSRPEKRARRESTSERLRPARYPGSARGYTGPFVPPECGSCYLESLRLEVYLLSFYSPSYYWLAGI